MPVLGLEEPPLAVPHLCAKLPQLVHHPLSHGCDESVPWVVTDACKTMHDLCKLLRLALVQLIQDDLWDRAIIEERLKRELDNQGMAESHHTPDCTLTIVFPLYGKARSVHGA